MLNRSNDCVAVNNTDYIDSRTGVLNLFAVKYLRVIKQSTRTPRLAAKPWISHCCITTTQDQAKSTRSFQSARIFL